ncbi:cupin domain-containing protein [Afifella sp. JA880]|uniref:cupin domain-containing protein n=1 Tax=Afifella sp. JA880 TaxID=2975280 RepID=UPI0021BBAD7C|nr:cupin domain-containing protein [Afifella sp. JA880]MCT8267933.1 cupin domain-containing protein [Afifella sp. JA880]
MSLMLRSHHCPWQRSTLRRWGWALLLVTAAGAASLYPPLHSRFYEMSDADGSDAAARPQTSMRILACTPLPDVEGKSITTAFVHFPPDAFTPEHRHPGSVTAYVLDGTIRSQLAGERTGTYVAGETWFEPPGAVHLFAENASSTEAADLLAIFVADDNCGPLTIFK